MTQLVAVIQAVKQYFKSRQMAMSSGQEGSAFASTRLSESAILDTSNGTNTMLSSTNGSEPHIDTERYRTENPEGKDFRNGFTNGVTQDSDICIPLWDMPAYTIPKKLRIITIGAGFSSLIFAHKLRYEYPEMEEIVTNTIFEARAKVGGTWLVNSYPGVQCDVPSHIYAFPFDPNPDWSHFYSTGPQIQEYIVKTVKKWNLDRDIQLRTRVLSTYWQEEVGQWKVVVEHEGRQREEYADILVSAQGFLNTWKWPAIPGLHDFSGHKVHSAAWDHSYDYSGKRIAVIGNGSSGIQILPALARLEGTQLTSFQRGPTWVVARMDPGRLLGKPNVGSNPEYTEEDKQKFREDREHHHQYRKNLIHRVNLAFRMVMYPCYDRCGLLTSLYSSSKVQW